MARLLAYCAVMLGIPVSVGTGFLWYGYPYDVVQMYVTVSELCLVIGALLYVTRTKHG